MTKIKGTINKLNRRSCGERYMEVRERLARLPSGYISKEEIDVIVGKISRILDTKEEASKLREAPSFEKQSLAAEQMLDHIPIPEGYMECKGLRELFKKGVKVMEKTDPWRHRSKGMTCSTCIWYVEKEAKDLPHAREDDLPIVGRCRRRAPTMNGYPVVLETDWCGDHKLDENKV